MIARRTLLAATLATPALAQPQWSPDRPIRLIVPLSAGGFNDIIARYVAAGISGPLGQPWWRTAPVAPACRAPSSSPAPRRMA